MVVVEGVRRRGGQRKWRTEGEEDGEAGFEGNWESELSEIEQQGDPEMAGKAG